MYIFVNFVYFCIILYNFCSIFAYFAYFYLIAIYVNRETRIAKKMKSEQE